MWKLGIVSRGLIALALITFFSNLPTEGGEDVANARNNALSGHPIDFWGGVSSFFYSHIPNNPLGWPVNLLIFQISIILLSLIIFAEQSKSRSKKYNLLFLIFSYFALVFGSHQTRDGLMFALAVLALSVLYSRVFITSKRIRAIATTLGISLLVFAFSLRPWVSLSCSIYLAGRYYFKNKATKNSYRLIISFLIFSVIPSATIAVEFVARNIVRIHTIHPEQQVISMDLGAAYCWSTNPKTVIAAREAMSLMYLDQNPQNICESFKPINWIWFSRKPIIENSNLPTTFTFLTEKNEQDFQKLKGDWIRLILTDPSSYIQNKYMFASQVFIAGDSRYIRVLSADYYSKSTRSDWLDLFIGIFFLPWDSVISLHLLSMQFILFSWLLLVVKQYRRQNSRHFEMDCVYLVSFLIWLVATVIAYIGDNGRYTYSASLALLFTLFVRDRHPLPVEKL